MTADQPSQADLTRVMDAHPMLCDYGYGKYTAAGFDHAADRAALADNLDQVRTAYAWLGTLHPASDRPWPTSYGLKHAGEHAGIGYVTNGAMIAAAYLAGVSVRVRPDCPNPELGVALTPPKTPAPDGSFTAWLAGHANANHPIGGLARDVAGDDCWPATGTDYRQFADHLAEHFAYEPAWMSLREAWEAYSGHPAPSDDENEEYARGGSVTRRSPASGPPPVLSDAVGSLRTSLVYEHEQQVEQRVTVTAVEQVFLECERARADGDLIKRVSASDKEYHFQNWVQARIEACALNYDDPGRNTYPDFRLVDHPEGYEVKGLEFPGREADYDSNSQVPMGRHNGREVFYVFGRYPKSERGVDEYPVVDLVVCHGSFLNADHEYVHKNKSFRGFGSYGDILVRDRKMYVVPTPFALASGTAGLATLILPASYEIQSDQLVQVGDLDRVEVDEVLVSYEFNMQTNEMVTHKEPNPNAGTVHRFRAYRSRGAGDSKKVTLNGSRS
ncbi:YozE family protein [Micromonospora sp. WMMD718]|uniref:YozE family protein n=1 Tax=Micromonospora TaxID=1873 RepID=UPI000A8EADC2|nr:MULTISPECIES: YozE family protein [unclassified Micromonospora]MDG4751288.1 YozE family protein [Micromonospora sp. WMMD718]